MTEVEFGAGPRLVSAAWVKRVVGHTLKREKASGKRVVVLLTDNRQIRRINSKHLGHDYATDVISFGMEEAGYLGDLAVSVQMARITAKELGLGAKEELARYLVHGTLHLLGYDDKKKQDHKRMHRRQEQLLKEIL